MVLILTTFHKKIQAVKIGKGLLKARLIVCYNLLPVESRYWWKGKLTSQNEIIMILKTQAKNFKKIEDYIKKYSEYEVPEVVGIRASRVNKPYLNWLNSETKT